MCRSGIGHGGGESDRVWRGGEEERRDRGGDRGAERKGQEATGSAEAGKTVRRVSELEVAESSMVAPRRRPGAVVRTEVMRPSAPLLLAGAVVEWASSCQHRSSSRPRADSGPLPNHPSASPRARHTVLQIFAHGRPKAAPAAAPCQRWPARSWRCSATPRRKRRSRSRLTFATEIDAACAG